MSDERVFVNDPIGQMKRENTETGIFDGIAILLDSETKKMVIYHDGCDTDIIILEDDNDFPDVLDKILDHLSECTPEDASDPWEDLLDAEGEEV